MEVTPALTAKMKAMLAFRQASLIRMTSILGRMATYSGQVIDWDKAINSGLDLHPSAYAFDAAAPVNTNIPAPIMAPIPSITKLVLPSVRFKVCSPS